MKKSHIIIVGLVLIGCAGIVHQVMRTDVRDLPGKTDEAAQTEKGDQPEVSQSEQGKMPDDQKRQGHERWEGKTEATGEKVAGPAEEKAAAARAGALAQKAVKTEAKPVQVKQDVKAGDATDPNAVGDPLDQLEAVNLKDTTVKDLLGKIAGWTGKVIIPDEKVVNQKLTIVSDQKLPRRTVLRVIYAALREKGFVAEEQDGVLYFKPLDEAKLELVASLSPDEPLAQIEDKTKVVQKFFRVAIYDPKQLEEIVKPLVTKEDGYVAADESTRMLMVIDKVSNLMRIEQIIMQLDVPEAEQMVTQIFEIGQGDPAEIVQLLRVLLSGQRGGSSGSGSSRSSSSYNRYGNRYPSRLGGGSSQSGSAVVLSFSQHPVLLIPEPNRKWVIARASPDDMKVIEE